jgi:hydrogenase maturation factor
VVDPAQAAAAELPVGAMHDPTEGGLATGLREIAQASGVGLVVDASRLIVAEETRAVCRVLNVDPLGLISSGCLIFTVPGDRGQAAAELMRSRGWSAAVIGRLTDAAGEYYLDDERGARPLPEFQADELARLA